MRVHYPRTPHLPWSPGATSDDVRTGDLSGLRGREVVVTEKLDGENTTLYRDGSHARSLDSAHHPSRAWVKALQGRIGGAIPEGWRVSGENVFARHAIPYDDLEGYFYGFSVWDGEHCLGWDATVRFLRRIGVPTPPVLWRGVFDERALRGLRVDVARQEGYVVRTVEGFRREEFGGRLAKWVRAGHVQESDTHWMFAEVVPNRLGRRAALWAARSGGVVEAAELLAAVGWGGEETEGVEGAERPEGVEGVPRPEDAEAAAATAAETVTETAARLDAIGRVGDARLAGLLAAALHREQRAHVAARLATPLGLPTARRVADLVGLAPKVRRAHPDEERRAGLTRMAFAADLGVLHALAAATARDGEEREQVEWSALCAEDAGLVGASPFATMRAELRGALSDFDDVVADRCWGEARAALAGGRIVSAAEAVAATWRWREGRFPQVVQVVGPSGSGKSAFAEAVAAGSTAAESTAAASTAGTGSWIVVSQDELRRARGSRADQRHNDAVLAEALDRLEQALAGGGNVVWDATSLTRQQRSLVASAARRRDALVTQAVLVVEEGEVRRRNADRAHPVPAEVLAAQLRRFAPPYPGEAHRIWYVGASGKVEDTDGALRSAPDGWDEAGF